MQRKISILTAVLTLFTLTAFAAKESAAPANVSDVLIHVNTEADFSKIIASAKPALVDFYADWCGPCRMLAPTMEKLAEKSDDKYIVAKVNVDKLDELSGKYKVRGIPCVILFKDGKEVDRIVGLRSEKDYKTALDKALKK